MKIAAHVGTRAVRAVLAGVDSLEDRCLLSSVLSLPVPALLDVPLAPAGIVGTNHPATPQGPPDHANGEARGVGLGNFVPGWAHEGIVGRDLAERIAEYQGRTNTPGTGNGSPDRGADDPGQPSGSLPGSDPGSSAATPGQGRSATPGRLATESAHGGSDGAQSGQVLGQPTAVTPASGPATPASPSAFFGPVAVAAGAATRADVVFPPDVPAIEQILLTDASRPPLLPADLPLVTGLIGTGELLPPAAVPAPGTVPAAPGLVPPTPAADTTGTALANFLAASLGGMSLFDAVPLDPVAADLIAELGVAPELGGLDQVLNLLGDWLGSESAEAWLPWLAVLGTAATAGEIACRQVARSPRGRGSDASVPPGGFDGF